MITRTATIRQTPDWQQQLAQAITDPAELLGSLSLCPEDLADTLSANRLFPLRVPRSFVERMEPGNPRDPLLLQVLPGADELTPADGFIQDPVGDHRAMVTPGLLHKYQGRALLLATGACGIHCRYCFRRHFPYAQANPSRNEWNEAIHYLSANTEIKEVILSGGDPLSLTDEKLERLVNKLENIPHLKRLRIHTRLPVVVPGRVCTSLLDWLGNTRLQVVMVIHCNHVNEIDTTVQLAMTKLKKVDCELLNQSVLLKGINDSVSELARLSEKLMDTGVLPYYLHLLDRTEGTSHFETDEEKGKKLVSALNQQLPGYLVPKLVREVPGEASKTPVC